MMRAIILAGGLGRRLGPLTHGTQKCLLEIAGETVLARAMRLLSSAGIGDITIVTGHCEGLVRAEIARRFAPERVTFVHNSRYDSTSTAYPLWLARFGLNEAMLLLDGDVVFESAVLTRMLTSSDENVIAVSTRGAFDDEQVKVMVDDLGRVTHIAKSIDPVRAFGEAVGMAILSRATLTHLFPTLERRVITEDRQNELYEAAIQELLLGKRLLLRAVDLGGLRCLEIDTFEDLRRARALFDDDAVGKLALLP